jgi:hypothetical protein
MGGTKPLALSLAAFAAAAAGSWPASGQCRLCNVPTTARPDDTNSAQVSLEIQTNLDFDRLILSTAAAGGVLVRPDGSASVQGAVAGVSPRVMVGSAVVRGEPGRAVRIELPPRIVLYSVGGGQITLDAVMSDLPAFPRLDASGRLTFRFGGHLQVRGDSDGAYHGDLPITVEYL